MAATKVLVIYSVDQKVRRTTVVLDHAGADDSQFAAHESAMVPGESALYIPLDVFESFGDISQGPGRQAIDSWLADEIGPPTSDRCAVITGDGDVVAVIAADPRIDEHPDGFLIQEPEAVTGDTYDFATQELSSGDA